MRCRSATLTSAASGLPRRSMMKCSPPYAPERIADRVDGAYRDALEPEWGRSLMPDDVALAAEQVRLLTRQQAAVDKAHVEAQDRFRIGDRPITDTHEAAARAADLKAQRVAAEIELELRKAALAELSGLRRTANYAAPFLSVEDGVRRYVEWLLASQ